MEEVFKVGGDKKPIEMMGTGKKYNIIRVILSYRFS